MATAAHVLRQQDGFAVFMTGYSGQWLGTAMLEPGAVGEPEKQALQIRQKLAKGSARDTRF